MEISSDKPSRRKWLILGPLFPLVLVAVWLAYRFAFPAYERPVQPVPNAYIELVSLADKLARRTGFYTEMSDQELATVAAANEQLLIHARAALHKESVVPLNWDVDRNWLGKVHINRGGKLRELARAFAAEGRHAQQQGDTRRAVSCGLDALQLVPVASRGGLGVDYLIALGIDFGSVYWLREACETATLEDCQYVLNNLPDIQKQMEPPAQITEREWHFFRQVNGAWSTFLTEMTFANNREDFEKRLQESLKNGQTLNDLLCLHYAIRAFFLFENRLPKTLEELAGRELKEIPLDPYAEKDFVYLPGKKRYLLYSVGLNGIDDGGVKNEQDREQGDLFLEPQEDTGGGMPAVN